MNAYQIPFDVQAQDALDESAATQDPDLERYELARAQVLAQLALVEQVRRIAEALEAQR